MSDVEKKELPFERVLFFSDAIVTIAITLLAQELKIDIPEGRPLRFADLISALASISCLSTLVY